MQASAVQQCVDVLTFLDHFTDIMATVRPLGKRIECEVEIVGGKVWTKQVKAALAHCGCLWPRPGM